MKQLILRELKRQRKSKKDFDRKWDIIDKKLNKILFMILWLGAKYQELKMEKILLSESYRQLDNRISTLEKRVFAS